MSFGVVFRAQIFSFYSENSKGAKSSFNSSEISQIETNSLVDQGNLIIDALQNDSLYSHLFFIYALLIVSLFLYGISDRFFISNSYELEYPILVFFLHICAILLMSVHNLIEFVLAIEIITLGSYGLTAYERTNRFSTFAGVQYFVIGSVPSGLLILSIALIYKI